MRDLPFTPPVLLAPMEGVTSAPLRALLVEHGGLGCVCTEFVRITEQALPRRRKLAALVEKAPGVALSVQVMGRDVGHMEEAARIMSEAGADVVDINLGCPSPNAARGGVGAAMLKDLCLLADVVGAMRRAVPGVLSAKMRAGFDDASGVLDRARVLVDCGVDYLVVHPRRRVDFYDGVADWRIIRTLARALPIPVVGNGDVWSASDAVRMRSETGARGVMIGRPALRNPWIFAQLAALDADAPPPAPTGADVTRYVERFVATFADAWGKVPVGRLKELVRWLARAVPDDGAFQRRVLACATATDIVARFHDEIAPLPAAALDLGATSTYALERSGRAGDDVDDAGAALGAARARLPAPAPPGACS